MTSFSLCPDQTNITKKMEGVIHDNKYHYKTKTRHMHHKKGYHWSRKEPLAYYSLTQEG